MRGDELGQLVQRGIREAVEKIGLAQTVAEGGCGHGAISYQARAPARYDYRTVTVSSGSVSCPSHAVTSLAPAPLPRPAWPCPNSPARCRSSPSGIAPRPSPGVRRPPGHHLGRERLQPGPRRQARHRGRLRHGRRRAPIRSTRSSPACRSSSWIPRTSRSDSAGCPTRKASSSSTRACMHGPTKRAGSVGALEDIADAAAVAQEGDGLHRPHHARRRRREEVRARDGLQGAESPHRGEPAWTGCAGSRGSTRATTGSTPARRRARPRRRRARSDDDEDASLPPRLLRRARRAVHVRHDQHERRHRDRRHRAR